MSRLRSAIGLLLSAGFCASAPAQQIPEITVIGSNQREDAVNITPGASAAPTPDSMDIISRLPGGAVNRNGPLSGQAQYRGLYGPRITVLINSMRVTPGGLNWMDSPMHYMPPGLTSVVTLTRGIAPVSSGPGIGGVIQAESKQPDFGVVGELQTAGDFVLSAMSNDGYALSGLLGLANDIQRLHLFASRDDGGDIEFGDGVIGGSSHERDSYGFGYGLRWRDTELSLEYTHTDTGLTGTPALPLDIDFFDTDRVNVGLETTARGITWSARIFYTDIAHAMNNFLLREPPDNSSLPLPPFAGTERRKVDVESQALGFVLSARFPLAEGELAMGLDGNFEEHSGLVKDPDVPPFYVENFRNAEQQQYGLYAEWRGELARGWQLELGLRYNRNDSDADAVAAQPADLCDAGFFPPGSPPCAVAMLRDRFNSAVRSLRDETLDAVVKLDWKIRDSLVLSFGYGHKTRAPSYIERYLWIPLEINSGLGDLNNYVGNPALDAEESDQFEAGLEWRDARLYVSPRLFYRRISDYIQGVASTEPVVIAVSGAANGDPTPLRFANTEAELYGADVVVSYRLAEQLKLDATLNYVRGRNTQLNDNLYRIAPLNGRLAISWETDIWSVTFEGVAAARQNKLSRTIVLDEPRSSNAETPGWGVVNVYGQWRLSRGLQLRAGVANLFDRSYRNHLSGFNRVRPSDVAFGERLPGPGINWYGQIAYAW